MADTNSKPERTVCPDRRAEAIALCLDQGMPVAQVAARLGLSRSSLGRWLREARTGLAHSEQINAVLERLQAAESNQKVLNAQLSILRTELELLSAELSLALRGGALAQDPLSPPHAHEPDTRARWQPLSRSQLGQDLWVLETLNWKRGGYFVEFGATDGVLLSNSWLLETHFQWQGICCEPNPKLFRSLQANRRCLTRSDCVYGTSGERMQFVMADAFGGLSAHGQEDSHREKREAYATAGETLTLTTISLMDLLDICGAPKDIDYLSIDTEGSELAILEGIDWDRYRFHCLTIEHNFTPQRELIAQLLDDKGYRRIEAQWDDWFVLIDQG